MNADDEVTLKARVLDIWFKDDDTGSMELPQSKRWFMGGKALDQRLISDFTEAVDKAANGALDHWQDDAQCALALVVMLDQFNRNMYRGTAQAFAHDAKALSISRHCVNNALDESLPVTQRVFLYLPFEHDETAQSQQESIRLFTQLHNSAPPSLQDFSKRALGSAMEHKRIVDQFGRYPHRNACLGRTSTPEELAWLNSSGSRFGQ